MRTSLVIALCLVATAFFATEGLKMTHTGTRSDKISMCSICVEAMGEMINELLNIILNIGVVGSCADLCKHLPKEYEADVCNLICDVVGIELFIKLIEEEDPDPIYFCDAAKICPVTNNGTAFTNSISVSPASGPAGKKFGIVYNYTVTSYTSTGGVNVVVVPPAGFPLSGGNFNEGQPPGTYIAEFTLDTTPSENEPFVPGNYEVDLFLCAGDCSGRHRWSGVYCNGTSSFTITNN